MKKKCVLSIVLIVLVGIACFFSGKAHATPVSKNIHKIVYTPNTLKKGVHLEGNLSYLNHHAFGGMAVGYDFKLENVNFGLNAKLQYGSSNSFNASVFEEFSRTLLNNTMIALDLGANDMVVKNVHSFRFLTTLKLGYFLTKNGVAGLNLTMLNTNTFGMGAFYRVYL